MHNLLHSPCLTRGLRSQLNFKRPSKMLSNTVKSTTEQKCGFLVGGGSIPPGGQLEIVWADILPIKTFFTACAMKAFYQPEKIFLTSLKKTYFAYIILKLCLHLISTFVSMQSLALTKDMEHSCRPWFCLCGTFYFIMSYLTLCVCVPGNQTGSTLVVAPPELYSLVFETGFPFGT